VSGLIDCVSVRLSENCSIMYSSFQFYYINKITFSFSGRPPTDRTCTHVLFGSCDLDLDQMTLIHELDLDWVF